MVDCNRRETAGEGSGSTAGDDVVMCDGEVAQQVETIKRLFVERSENYGIPQLERLYSRIMKGIFGNKEKGTEDDPKTSILRLLLTFAEDEENF